MSHLHDTRAGPPIERFHVPDRRTFVNTAVEQCARVFDFDDATRLTLALSRGLA